MGSVHVMISVVVLVYSFSVQRVEANFRIDLSRRLRTVRASIPLFTDALIMCNISSITSSAGDRFSARHDF